MAKTGRGSDKFMLRLPDGMRDRIKASADANGRSMNAEMVHMLGSSESLRSELARAREALAALLKEHDILSGNFGADVMDPKHARPDRWPHAAALARAVLRAQERAKIGEPSGISGELVEDRDDACFARAALQPEGKR